jgi:CBS domain containing-hemolysin-like protein
MVLVHEEAGNDGEEAEAKAEEEEEEEAEEEEEEEEVVRCVRRIAAGRATSARHVSTPRQHATSSRRLGTST